MAIQIVPRPLGSATGVFDADERRTVGPIRRCRHTIARWVARSRQRRQLREIVESNEFYLLKDIGISQDEALREADKPFWRL